MIVTVTSTLTSPFTVDELLEYAEHLRTGKRTGMMTTTVGDDGAITISHTTAYPDDVNRP